MSAKLSMNVNGIEKFASGITNETTVDDLKFAMLISTDSSFRQELLDQYGIFEQWQNSERILDGHIKMYKIIRLWEKLPGDQLSQVKFVIKKRLPISILKQSTVTKLCTLSPNVKNPIHEKSSFVQRQFQTLNKRDDDLVSIISSTCSSVCDESEEGRFAIIKRQIRDRKSSVKRMNEHVKLVKQQDEHLERLKQDLARIDDIICHKTKLIQSFQQRSCTSKKFLSCCSNSSSSISSTDTGISSTSYETDLLNKNTLETLV